MGGPLREDIPDCAWVPRRAMKITSGEGRMGDEPGVFCIDISIVFTEPFRWAELKYTIDVEVP